MNEESLVAIYDFGIYPYALGDILTFNTQNAVKCIKNKKKRIILLICCDQNYCSNFDQRSFINCKNYKYFYKEIFPAFEAQAIECELIEFSDRKILIEFLKGLKNLDDANTKEINDYLFHIKFIKNDLSVLLAKLVKKIIHKEINSKTNEKKSDFRNIIGAIYEFLYNKLNINRLKINEFYIKNIYSHQRINLFFKYNKYIPELKINHAYVDKLNKFLEIKFKNKQFIAIHIRQRKNDTKFDNSSLYRDSNNDAWFNFLKATYLRDQNIIFILLGRSEEKSSNILSLPNVINLRDFGLNLGHDLAAIKISKAFIGSSSGFAAYANFNRNPYLITNINNNSCKAYQINYGSDSLPFANPEQKLAYGQESVELLNYYLKLVFGNNA